MNKFSRWLTSKAGMQTLIGIVAVLIVIIIIGALLGWWAELIELIIGTVTPPMPTYPPPVDGYTCLPSPDCDVTDGRFLSSVGEQFASFAGNETIVWVSVPGDYETFEVSIFDGDSGKDNNGQINYLGGNWDNTLTQSTYTLYTDAGKDGPNDGEIVVGAWVGNDVNALNGGGTSCTASAETMPNNDWYTITCNRVPEAQGASGHYFYRLEITRPPEGLGVNAYELRSNAYLSTGQSELVDANIAIVGMLATVGDAGILWPNMQSWSDMGPCNYDGTWDFYFYVPPAEYPTRTVTIEIWDGDFDRGTSASADSDTDDINTKGKPPWAGPFAKDEGVGGVGGRGAPPDDYFIYVYRIEPPVQYTIVDPSGEPFYTNEEPSGTEEWERYVVSTDPDLDPDNTASTVPAEERADKFATDIEPGWYLWHIEGLDLHNTVWIRFNYDIVSEPGPDPCEPTCPRTIGYWKNNVAKVLGVKGGRAQETKETLEAALRRVAELSPLFRHGIDVQNPVPIDDPTPLTLEEAHMILQRDQQTYPGGAEQARSMLARALQQNLAAWLNLGSGKICKDNVVTLVVVDGKFDGIIWKALLEAQDIILYKRDDATLLERAKDIGDQINNGNLGEEATLELLTCDISDPNDEETQKVYKEKFPPGEQPPKPSKGPKAPKPPKPPKPTPVPEPDPETCAGVRVNQYSVELTDNPFHGIKFEYQSGGTEIKSGGYEEFQIVLTQEQAASITEVQLEAKAGALVGTLALENCDFASEMPCGGEPVQDENGYFAFYFKGATDNGDGTLTLTFFVQNLTDQALSHATIGLPDGVVPSSPTDSYESKVCP